MAITFSLILDIFLFGLGVIASTTNNLLVYIIFKNDHPSEMLRWILYRALLRSFPTLRLIKHSNKNHNSYKTSTRFYVHATTMQKII